MRQERNVLLARLCVEAHFQPVVRTVRFRTSPAGPGAYLPIIEIASRQTGLRPRSQEQKRRFTMKTIIALVTTTMLVAGASSAMASPQGSDEAAGYALSRQAAHGIGGAYASARVPGEARNSTVNVQDDFQLDGR